MSQNPLMRFGAPKQITCSLGVSGEFSAYVSGLSYSGTVNITGAQGTTTVELVPPIADSNNAVYTPVPNGGFESAGGWVVDGGRSPPVSPGFSIQTGTGRSGTGFVRWQGDPNGAQDKFNSTTAVKTPGSGVINARVWVRCTAHTGGGGVVQAAIRIEQFSDAACTTPLNTTVSEFANFTAVDTNWRDVRSWSTDFGGYCRVSLIVTQGIVIPGFNATVEFDDAEWDAREVITGPLPTLGLPSGFTIDTVTTPDRVRVQWPGIPSGGGGGTSTLANLDLESGDANWLKGAGWSITNAAPTDGGTWSAKYIGLGQANIAHETLAPVTPGTSITASCRVSKGNNRADFAGGAVVLQWFTASLAPAGFAVGNVVNTGTSAFQTSTVTATAPAGAAYVRLAASGTRDTKGRASDAVTVDTFVWNHTFALGGSGGSGGGATPVTGPVTFSFRVTDSQGCTTVATRTIESINSTGTWILFARPQASSNADQYSISSFTPTSWSGSKRLAVAGGNAGDVYISGFGGGSLYAAQLSGWVIRSTNLGATWSTTSLIGCSQNQRIDVRNGRVMFAIPSAFRYSDDNGATVTTSSGRPINERYFYGTNEILGGNRSGEDLLYSSDNGANRDFVSGFPTYGSGRNPVNLCAGSTHIVVAGSSSLTSNRFSRVPISTPLASHTPFTVSAVSSTATWAAVAPSIAYGNGIFVMVTDQGQIVRSTDEGATWTVSSFTFPNPRSLVYGDGVFLICGNAGAIYTSTNGNTWTQINSGTFGTDDITNAIFIPN